NDIANNIAILLGTGTGSFAAATNFAVGTLPLAVAVGDFTGDGKQDVVTANHDSNDVSVLLRQCTPSISKSFGTSPIDIGDTSTLTITVTNPNPSLTLTGVGFTDSLPTGLTAANSSTPQCGG